jgi:hypothetical protein
MIGPAPLRLAPLLATWTLLFLLVGCAEPTPSVLTFEGERYPEVREQIVDALRDEGFTVDRNDPRMGVFTSDPRPASTLLELFKLDNTTLAQAWESTAHQQRRRVRVIVEPADGPVEVEPEDASRMTQTSLNPPPPTFVEPEGLLDLRVMVFVDRAAQPHWRVETTTRRLSSRATEPELLERGMQPIYWQPISRDPLMEERLMRRIIEGITPEAPDAGRGASPTGLPDA